MLVGRPPLRSHLTAGMGATRRVRTVREYIMQLSDDGVRPTAATTGTTTAATLLSPYSIFDLIRLTGVAFFATGTYYIYLILIQISIPAVCFILVIDYKSFIFPVDR